jgi:hypothetical protein
MICFNPVRPWGRDNLVGLAILSVVLAGCSHQQSYYETPSLAGAPPSRQTIAGDIPQIFQSSANPREIEISEIRPWTMHDISGWLVCVRAQVDGINGGGIGGETMAVFFERQEISLRWRAGPNDECGTFEKL